MSDTSLATIYRGALDELTGSVLGLGRTVVGCIGYICSPYKLEPLAPIAEEESTMLSADPYAYINHRATRRPICCGAAQLERRETYLPRYSQTNKLSHRRLPENAGTHWPTPAARVAVPVSEYES